MKLALADRGEPSDQRDTATLSLPFWLRYAEVVQTVWNLRDASATKRRPLIATDGAVVPAASYEIVRVGLNSIPLI